MDDKNVIVCEAFSSAAQARIAFIVPQMNSISQKDYEGKTYLVERQYDLTPHQYKTYRKYCDSVNITWIAHPDDPSYGGKDT